MAEDSGPVARETKRRPGPRWSRLLQHAVTIFVHLSSRVGESRPTPRSMRVASLWGGSAR
jgi:hypothetical protein